MRRRLALEEELRAASGGEGLELYMQPIVSMRRGRQITGAEALLRWNHPRLGLLAPDAFIPVAEETGLIVPIGRWVLRTAAEAAVRWNRRPGARRMRVAVNFSTRQFVLDDVADAVRQTLRETGCDPTWLVAEITESLLLEDSERVRGAIDALRSQGVAVAIDDFGTGYSALHYLARFHVDLLKIDKVFVHGIGGGRGGELVKAFIAMASALELEVVAEGVETEAQARFLREHGCRYGQGYHFGRPMPVPAFERLLEPAQPCLEAAASRA